MTEVPTIKPYLLFHSPLEPAPKCVVVLGVARGGTSMVAGILRILGVDMGSDLDEDNNEDTQFLSHAGDRRVFNEVEFVEKKMEYLLKVRDYISGKVQQPMLWGWKDPLTIYYLEDVLDLLPDPAFVFVTRDPVAIACREGLDPQNAGADAALAVINSTAAEYAKITNFLTGFKNRSMLISYERAIRHPKDIVEATQHFLGVPSNPNIMLRAMRFVQPERNTANINMTSESAIETEG